MRQDKAEKVVRDAAAAGANIILLQVLPFLAPSPAADSLSPVMGPSMLRLQLHARCPRAFSSDANGLVCAHLMHAPSMRRSCLRRPTSARTRSRSSSSSRAPSRATRCSSALPTWQRSCRWALPQRVLFDLVFWCTTVAKAQGVMFQPPMIPACRWRCPSATLSAPTTHSSTPWQSLTRTAPAPGGTASPTSLTAQGAHPLSWGFPATFHACLC